MVAIGACCWSSAGSSSIRSTFCGIDTPTVRSSGPCCLLHTTHIGTDWVDTVVLAALMHTRMARRRGGFVDTDENALYWRFVWLCWIPIYLLIYWVPRMFR